MASRGLQVLGIVLCLTASIVNLYILVFPEWRRNDPQGSIVEMVSRTQGLWMSCVRYSTGQFSCDEFDRFFINLPSAIIGARVCCLIAGLLSLVGLVLGLVSSGCTNFMPPSNKKHRLFILTSVLFCLASVCTCIAVSWYFATVLSQYFSYGALVGGSYAGGVNMGFGERYVAGYCIYLGWVATVLGLGGSVVMCCTGNASNTEYETHEDRYRETNDGYQPYNSPEGYDNAGATLPGNTTRQSKIDADLALYPPPANATRGPGPYRIEQPRSTDTRGRVRGRNINLTDGRAARGYTNTSYI